jgi:hypothetical protein
MATKMTVLMKLFFHLIGERVRCHQGLEKCIFRCLTFVLLLLAGQILDDQLHDMLVKRIPAGAKLTALMVRKSQLNFLFRSRADRINVGLLPLRYRYGSSLCAYNLST